MKNREALNTYTVSLSRERSDLKLAYWRYLGAFPRSREENDFAKLLAGDTAKVKLKASDFKATLIYYYEQNGDFTPADLFDDDEDMSDYTKIVGFDFAGNGGALGKANLALKKIRSGGQYEQFFDADESKEIMQYAEKIAEARAKIKKEDEEERKREEEVTKPTEKVKKIDPATCTLTEELYGYLVDLPTNDLYQAILQETIALESQEEREAYIQKWINWANESAGKVRKLFDKNVYSVYLEMPKKLTNTLEDLRKREAKETGDDLDVDLRPDDIIEVEARKLFQELKTEGIEPEVFWEKCKEAAQKIIAYANTSGTTVEAVRETMISKLLSDPRISRRTEADRLVEEQEKKNRTLKNPDQVAYGDKMRKYLLDCFVAYYVVDEDDEGYTKYMRNLELFKTCIAYFENGTKYTLKHAVTHLEASKFQPHIFMAHDYDKPTRV